MKIVNFAKSKQTTWEIKSVNISRFGYSFSRNAEDHSEGVFQDRRLYTPMTVSTTSAVACLLATHLATQGEKGIGKMTPQAISRLAPSVNAESDSER